MELRHLRYFVAVAEELSFTRAAERLGIKQPPLSLQIRQLEIEMGTPLFRRLTRGIELTAAGSLLLEEARDILESVERAKTDVKRRARGESGQIWIGYSSSAYFHPTVNNVTREFCARYPGVIIFAEEGSSGLLPAKVRANVIDAAFVWTPAVEFKDLGIVSLADDNCVIMLPEKHSLSRLNSIPLAALANEKFFLFPRRMNLVAYDAVTAACRHAGFQPNFGFEVPPLAIFPVVAAGLGISILPQCLTRIHVEGVSVRPIEGDPLSVRLSLTYRRNDKSPAVTHLVSMARRIGETGPHAKGTEYTVA